jgi:hypothetical protein
MMRSTTLRAAVPACFLLLVSAVASGDPQAAKLAPPKPAVALRPAKLEKLDGEACGKCHADVIEEWVSTAHAIAWVDEVYKDEVKDKTRPEGCYGCHAPNPILAAGLAQRAEVRADGRDLGISCVACHQGPDGAILGATGKETPAHKTAKSDSMTDKASSAMCAVCHSTNIGPVVGIAKDYFTAKLDAQGKTCVGCHMGEVDRKASEGGPAKTGRSHSIQTPRDPSFLARAFTPSVRVEGGKTIVALKNEAGHRIPGLIGRTIEFQVEVLGADGKPAGKGSLVLDAKSYLPVQKSAEIPVAAAGTSVRVRGFHHDPRSETPIPFLDATLEPSGR